MVLDVKLTARPLFRQADNCQYVGSQVCVDGTSWQSSQRLMGSQNWRPALLGCL